MEEVRLGRPRERLLKDQDDPLDKYDVRLTSRQARLMRKLGKGNLSEGVRQAIEKAVLAFKELDQS